GVLRVDRKDIVAEYVETNKLICRVKKIQVPKGFLRFQGTKSGLEKALTTRMESHSMPTFARSQFNSTATIADAP
ncbi:hypothetical protein L195_g050888, partial [Trifolium pratense]